MAYRSSSIRETVTSPESSTDPGLPTGTQSTDVLVAVWVGYAASISAPAGWTLIETIDLSFSSTKLRVWWALGSVSSTNFTGSTMNGVIRISAFTGRNTSSPITASGSTEFTDISTTMLAPSVTAASGDDIFVFWGNVQGSGTAFGANPGGVTAIDSTAHSVPDMYMASSYKEAVTAGATGTFDRSSGTGTGSQSRPLATVAIAQSSGSGGTATTAWLRA